MNRGIVTSCVLGLLCSLADSIQAKENTGLIFSAPEQYEAVGIKTRDLLGGLPEFIDLSSNVPVPGDQGSQSSCVGWAAGYGLGSYIYSKVATKEDIIDSSPLRASPAFVYNSIKFVLNPGPKCGTGSTLSDALERMRTIGMVPYSDFPYDPASCEEPAQSLRQIAKSFRIKSYRKLERISTVDIKSMIATGYPVLVGMDVDMRALIKYKGGGIYRSTGDEGSGHAMLVVGYSDEKMAFKVMNSFGSDWGEGGFLWVSYSRSTIDMIREAYVASADPTQIYARSFDNEIESPIGAAIEKISPEIVKNSLRTSIGLKIGVTPEGYNYFPVAIWLDLNDRYSSQIEKAEYWFHHSSFNNPKLPESGSNSFLAKWRGWGCVNNAEIRVKPKYAGEFRVYFSLCELWRNDGKLPTDSLQKRKEVLKYESKKVYEKITKYKRYGL